jgi:phosphoglycolate phosphatase-like HAD superfamily hydrolase
VGPEEILFFGDHVFDYQCARDAGSGFVAVLTGTYTKADWMDVPGIEIFDSVGDYYDNLD